MVVKIFEHKLLVLDKNMDLPTFLDKQNVTQGKILSRF